jgi:hypothetical protein
MVMRRLHIFLAILIVTLSVLLTLFVIAWYYAATAPSYYGSSWMGQMWGGMMGSNYGGYYGGMGGMMGDGYYGTTASYLWVIPVVLIALVSCAVIGVGFYLVFPELRYVRSKNTCDPQKPEAVLNQGVNTKTLATESPAVPTVASISQNCDVLLKTMNSEEQRVMNVLIAHDGKYLQKYVVKEAGLSRLKTHRIIARFAQRGIVTVKEFGNTNEILLSDWIKTP